jgi:hypothetical protein
VSPVLVFLFVVLTQSDGTKVGQDLAAVFDKNICAGMASILNAHPDKPKDQSFHCREGKPGSSS